MNVLEVADLGVHAGPAPLIKDVSFHIGPGERVGLIGESGSGKSLTAMSIMGLLPEGVHATGSVQLEGIGPNLVGLSERQAAPIRGRDISMVFQEPMTALNPVMKVGDQVAEVMLLHRTKPNKAAADAAAIELLEQVRLPNPSVITRSFPHQLSGGQRQRVMLAIALANNPRLLICDEPTTALDVTVQARMLDLILALAAERGNALLFITHDLAVVAQVCQRVLVMYNGELVESGETRQVFTAPKHPYTQALLAASDLGATDERGRLFTVSTVNKKTAASLQKPTTRVAAGGGAQDIAIGISELTRVYRRPRRSLFTPGEEVHALRGIDLDIPTGSRYGIVGESGSGKSTLMRLLSGLDRPTSGSIRFAGTEIAGRPESALKFLRRDLQIVFQDPMGSLDPRMSVRDIIAEPLVSLGYTGIKARVDELLDAVGLPRESAYRYPHQFSGGQRQRISIARALSPHPKVLVADEPVSALDVSVRAQILNLLMDLVDDFHLTLIFVSHDLSVVRYLCDTVAVMHEGSIVERGATAAVYENPQHPYTQSLLAAVPTLAKALGTPAKEVR